MKIEIGADFPQYFQAAYPEEFELFSHFETAAAIPSGAAGHHHLEACTDCP